MKPNVVLLHKIADIIEKEPDLWYQGDWTTEDQTNPSWIQDNEIHTCGTQACIAGWAVHLTPEHARPMVGSIKRQAQLLLGLYPDEADKLFSSSWTPMWPRSVSEELRRIAAGGWV